MTNEEAARTNVESSSPAPEEPVANPVAGAGPVFIFTKDGVLLPPPFPAPPGATDVHVFWDPMSGKIIDAWWTMQGRPGPAIPVPEGANDWYFSLRRGLPLLPPILPPPGANDSHTFWEDDRIIEAWWTRNGRPFERIPLAQGTDHLHLASSAFPSGPNQQVVASLIDTLSNPEFLRSIEERARAMSEEDIKAILRQVGQWTSLLGVVNSTEQLLDLPFAGTSEVESFGAVVALAFFYAAATPADCSKELADLLKAADTLKAAHEAWDTANKDLATAEASLEQANAEVAKAERDLKAAKELTAHTFWEPLGILSMLYEAAFRRALQNATQRRDDLLDQVRLLQELVKLREKAVSSADSKYAQALIAWMKCLAR